MLGFFPGTLPGFFFLHGMLPGFFFLHGMLPGFFFLPGMILDFFLRGMLPKFSRKNFFSKLKYKNNSIFNQITVFIQAMI